MSSSGQQTASHKTWQQMCQNGLSSPSPEQTLGALKKTAYIFSLKVHFSFVESPLASLYFFLLHSSLSHLVTMWTLFSLLLGWSTRGGLRSCWEIERGKKGREDRIGDSEGREERKGGSLENSKERETERRGVGGCSSSCGPGGELPNPGCSAETSMGGCVGSHHDSSGSLNENSDGTGGNLAGSYSLVSGRFGCLMGFPLQAFCMLSWLEVSFPAIIISGARPEPQTGSVTPSTQRDRNRGEGALPASLLCKLNPVQYPAMSPFVLCCWLS